MHIRSHLTLKFFITVSVLSTLLGTTANAFTVSECELFSRNLKVGMSGADVLMLQRLLNLNQATKIATDGYGSPGNETVYFGTKTKIAVIKFQELYRTEVLTPAGLVSGTGFVGLYSRTKLHGLCLASFASANTHVNNTPSSTPSIAPTNITLPTTPTPEKTTGGISSNSATLPVASSMFGFKSETPVIMMSPNVGDKGATVTIPALGLTATDNIVHLDANQINKTTSDGGSVTFIIPQDVAHGRHLLWLSNSKGESNKKSFVVTDPAIAGPKLVSFTPQEGFLGTKVVVVGSGFLSEGNDIHVSYGVITNVASPDGKTLEFNMTPPIPGLKIGEDRPEFDTSVPYWFSVVNDNGVSEPAIFNLKV